QTSTRRSSVSTLDRVGEDLSFGSAWRQDSKEIGKGWGDIECGDGFQVLAGLKAVAGHNERDGCIVGVGRAVRSFEFVFLEVRMNPELSWNDNDISTVFRMETFHHSIGDVC